jgi:DNA repair ATPase RecN
MSAGVLGLILSLSCLAGILVVRPGLVAGVNSAVDILYTSVDTSLKATEITDDTLTATANSVEALAEMLTTTVRTVDDANLVLDQLNEITGEKLPETLEAASTSLKAAEQAANSLEGAIKSFAGFQKIVSGIPLLNAFVPKSNAVYMPEKPLAESLGEMASSLEEIPGILTGMSINIGKADENLDAIQDDMEAITENVVLIAEGFRDYKSIVKDSISSLEQMKTMLENAKEHSPRTINWITVVLALFFLWLIAAQVVIFSQGWELFHGAANRIDGPNSSSVLDSQQIEGKS